VLKFVSRTGMALSAGALLLLLACQSVEQRETTPGALPSARRDVAPRLSASTFVAHGHLLEQQGNLERAEAQYRAALQLTPDLLAAQNRLGITLNKLGRHEEASALFQEALIQHPAVAHLHNNLGFSLYLEEKYEQAERTLARSLEFQPSFRRARMNHALVLAKLERFDDALTGFLLACSEPEAHYNLAVVQADAGFYAEAARSLEKALNLNPEFAEAREQLRQLSRLIAAAEAQPAVADDDVEVITAEPVLSTNVGVADEVQPAANVELVEEEEAVQAEALPERGDVNAEEIFAQIDALLAAAGHDCVSEPPPTWSAVDAEQLLTMFDELIDAMVKDGPWYDACLRRLERTLGARG